MRKQGLYLLGVLFVAAACHMKETGAEEDPVPESVQTPVTITTVESVPLETFIELNATSSFLQSNSIKATASGYIKTVSIALGKRVSAGQLAFTLKTKEAAALGNTINNLDSTFHFSGLLHVKATTSGYVQELNHHAGDYVLDGEQLAVVSDLKSFGFVMNLPYALRRYVKVNSPLDVLLPDDTRLKGQVASFLPNIDSASQTQGVLIRVSTALPLPQNLVAKVQIRKLAKTGALSLPKQAVLSNEAQSEFWVMQLQDSTTAVKVPVIKGMETNDRVEILRSQFVAGDKIVLSGNYGLPDTANVKIVNSDE